MSPFPELVESLGIMKKAGYRLCVMSNANGAIIAGNVCTPDANVASLDNVPALFASVGAG